MEHIIKRKGHREPYEERKVYASVYAACMVLRVQEEEAEAIASMVTSEITDSVKEHKELAAHSLQNHISKSLKKYHPDAAYMYDSHRDLS